MEHSDNETTNHCATKTWNCWSMWNVENEMMRKWYTKSCLVLSWKLVLKNPFRNEVYDQNWMLYTNQSMNEKYKICKEKVWYKNSSLDSMNCLKKIENRNLHLILKIWFDPTHEVPAMSEQRDRYKLVIWVCVKSRNESASFECYT